MKISHCNACTEQKCCPLLNSLFPETWKPAQSPIAEEFGLCGYGTALLCLGDEGLQWSRVVVSRQGFIRVRRRSSVGDWMRSGEGKRAFAMCISVPKVLQIPVVLPMRCESDVKGFGV